MFVHVWSTRKPTDSLITENLQLTEYANSRYREEARCINRKMEDLRMDLWVRLSKDVHSICRNIVNLVSHSLHIMSGTKLRCRSKYIDNLDRLEKRRTFELDIIIGSRGFQWGRISVWLFVVCREWSKKKNWAFYQREENVSRKAFPLTSGCLEERSDKPVNVWKSQENP